MEKLESLKDDAPSGTICELERIDYQRKGIRLIVAEHLPNELSLKLDELIDEYELKLKLDAL